MYVTANDFRPQAIRIVDISPWRQSVRRRPATAHVAPSASGRRLAAALAATMAVAALAAVITAGPSQVGAGAGSAAATEFRLSPGNAVPVSLAARSAAATEFRLSPGNAVPVSLAAPVSTPVGHTAPGVRLAPGHGMPTGFGSSPVTPEFRLSPGNAVPVSLGD